MLSVDFVMELPCEGDQSRALQEIPQLNYMLQLISRRFLKELDEAPGGNNLQYIY